MYRHEQLEEIWYFRLQVVDQAVRERKMLKGQVIAVRNLLSIVP
jgi:hypothetical protein